MAKSPFQVVLFHPFMAALKRAAASGHRIEPSQKQAWAQFIREHKVPIAGLMVYGQSLSETIKAVAISGEGEGDGLYLYSEDDEVSVKFVREVGLGGAGGAASSEPAPVSPPSATPAEAPAAPPPAAG